MAFSAHDGERVVGNEGACVGDVVVVDVDGEHFWKAGGDVLWGELWGRLGVVLEGRPRVRGRMR